MHLCTPVSRRAIAAALASTVLAACGAALAAGAPITSVTLYPGAATITRTATVAAGSTELVVEGVTSSFDVQTLRVTGGTGIRVGQVETKDAARIDSANPAQADLESRIQAGNDEVALLDAQASAADVVKDYLARLGAPAGDAGLRASPDVKTLAATLDIINRSASEALERKARLAVQRRDLQKKLAALQRDLQRLRGNTHESRTITIHLTAARAGDVQVSYQLNTAGWRPSYRAELDSTRSSVALTRLAEVSQKSGEDWKDVKIVLSTSQPRLSPMAPEAEPWLLDFVKPIRVAQGSQDSRLIGEVSPELRPARAPAPMVIAAREKGTAAPEAPPPPPPYEPPTFEMDSAYTSEFEVPARVNLPADGRVVTLELNAQPIDVRQTVLVVRRAELAGTLTAQAARPDGVWPPGEMQLYRDGNYVGRGPWSLQASDKLELSFGRDELLRVTVDPIKSDSAEAGFFGKRNQKHISDLITLRSAHTAPIDVRLVESSPESIDENVTVRKTFDPKPAIESWEQKRGVVAWERSLKPGEAAKFSVDYVIEFPKDGSVTGLP
jgi:uncharacterized protein (TIGR02231 family)